MLSSGDYRCFFCLASLKLFACCFAMSNITLFVHRESVWFAIANGGGVWFQIANGGTVWFAIANAGTVWFAIASVSEFLVLFC